MVCDDLIFTSKVTATARAAGLTVTPVRSADAAVAAARKSAPACVLVDLHNPGLDLPALLADLRAACPAMPRVIGYGSHVDVAALKAARAAGCDAVLPRSQFVAELDAKLPEWLG
jgi:CheY-like chemotaxis protein